MVGWTKAGIADMNAKYGSIPSATIGATTKLHLDFRAGLAAPSVCKMLLALPSGRAV